MPDRIVFKNAPITEALLDIRVESSSEVSLEHLATMYEAVKQSYPHKRERISWQGGLELKPGGSPELKQVHGGPDGYLFTSSDGKQLLQARLDGFTFNRLKPYDKWETFRDEARKHWKTYMNISKAGKATRVALRYINRIEIPLPITDIKDYILTVPEIAPGISQGLAKFFMRLVIPVREAQAVAIVTESMEFGNAGNAVPVILDIDVICEAPLAINSSEIWNTFERLHDVKNDLFFKSVTDKAKELFK